MREEQNGEPKAARSTTAPSSGRSHYEGGPRPQKYCLQNSTEIEDKDQEIGEVVKYLQAAEFPFLVLTQHRG